MAKAIMTARMVNWRVLVPKSIFVTLVLKFITQPQVTGYTNEGENLLLLSNCVCSGYPQTAVAECTTAGTTLGITVWRGSVFNGCGSNEISLLHDSFYNPRQRECNDGSITAQGVRVQDNFFTSRLRINITSDMIGGKIIECAYDNAMGNETRIGSLIISQTELDMLWSPNDPGVFLSLANIKVRQISFNWSPVALDCPAVHYNILASNCGSCPITTNRTTVSCSDVPTDGSICIFAVQTVFCGRNVKNSSDVFHVALFKDISEARSSCTQAIVSAGLLAAIIVVSATSFIIVAAISVKRRQNCFAKRFTSSTVYDNTQIKRSPVAAATIDTNKNIAYGQVRVHQTAS